jgi:peptide/nickel transport system substrate-binding protein
VSTPKPAAEPTGEDTVSLQLSRRQLLLAGAAAGAAALAVPLTSASVVAQDTEEWEPAPVKFVWSDYGEPFTIDPAIVQDSASFAFARNVYEALVEIDVEKLEIIPRLATEWQTSEDGLTWTFKLRTDVHFHDGTPFDASAVKLSIERMLGIGQGSSFLIDKVSSVDVVDPATVTITTKALDPYMLAHLVKIGIVSPAAVDANKTADDPWAKDWFAENTAGSGPYKLTAWDKGAQLTLEKNQDWWFGWQPGSIDEVIFKWAGESTTRAQMLSRGEADLVGWLPPNDVVPIGNQPGFQLVEWKTFDTDPGIFLNTKKAPLDNLKVRQALVAAFDYQAVIDFYQGYGSTPGGPVPADFPGAGAQGFEPFKQDLDKAKQLIQESGIDPGATKLTIIVPSGQAEFLFGATDLQASAQQLGIEIEITEVPWAQMLELYKSDDTAGHITDFALTPYSLDPIQYLRPFYYSTGFYNMCKNNNPDVDQLIDQASTTADPTAREQLLSQAQTIIRDDALCIWGCTPRLVDAVPDYIVGYHMDITDYRWATKFYPIRIKKRSR